MNQKTIVKPEVLILVIIFSILVMTGCGMKNAQLTEVKDPAEIKSKTESDTIQSSDSSVADSPETSQIQSLPYNGNYPQHEPYGTGIGAMPGRVVWSHNPDSVEWDGSGYWWETDHFDEAVILKMVNDSIATLGGKDTAKDGWNALFLAHNKARNGSGGYREGEKIAIKANINGSAVFDDDTLSVQGDTRFCITDLRFCCVTVAQRTSSTLRSSALQNHKSVTQNSFGPQVPDFGGWQGNGMRRTGRTPIDVNAANRQKMALGACVPLYTEGTSGETQMSYTNPVLLKTLLFSLVKEGGVNPSDITVYDVSRLFPDYMVEMCTEGELEGIRFVGRSNGVADENAPIHWSHKFSGNVNYLPTCVTEATYLINLANLKGHSYGITLCGKNHFGSFINGNAMRPPEGANLHGWLTKSEMGIYSPLVDLMANANLGGKTLLYMLDALICAPSEGASITSENSRWQQAPFNGDYTSSIFVSQDPAAIDSVGADFLNNEPTVTGSNRSAADITNENYLHEAGLVGNPTSGTSYMDGNGHRVSNLGVHEHWNHSEQKQYSRNLGKDEGIELVQIK